jgi:hypothetical protein
MQLPEDWQEGIVTACQKFKAGKNDIDPGLTGIEVFTENGFVVVKMCNQPTAQPLVEVLAFIESVGTLKQVESKGIITSISILPF